MRLRIERNAKWKWGYRKVVGSYVTHGMCRVWRILDLGPVWIELEVRR